MYPGQLIASTSTLRQAAQSTLKPSTPGQASGATVGGAIATGDGSRLGDEPIGETANQGIDTVAWISASSPGDQQEEGMQALANISDCVQLPASRMRFVKGQVTSLPEQEALAMTAASQRHSALRVGASNTPYMNNSDHDLLIIEEPIQTSRKTRISEYLTAREPTRPVSSVPMLRPRLGTTSTLSPRMPAFVGKPGQSLQYVRGDTLDLKQQMLPPPNGTAFIDPDQFQWRQDVETDLSRYHAGEVTISAQTQTDLDQMLPPKGLALISIENPEGELARLSNVKAIEAEAERQRLLRERRARLVEIARAQSTTGAEPSQTPSLNSRVADPTAPRTEQDDPSEHQKYADPEKIKAREIEELARQMIRLEVSQSAGKGRLAAEAVMHKHKLVPDDSCVTCRQLKLLLDDAKRKLEALSRKAAEAQAADAGAELQQAPRVSGGTQTQLSLLDLLPQQEKSFEMLQSIKHDEGTTADGLERCDDDNDNDDGSGHEDVKERATQVSDDPNGIQDPSAEHKLDIVFKGRDLIRFAYEVERVTRQRAVLETRRKRATEMESNAEQGASNTAAQPLKRRLAQKTDDDHKLLEEQAIESDRLCDIGCQTEWSELTPSEEQVKMREALELFEVLKAREAHARVASASAATAGAGALPSSRSQSPVVQGHPGLKLQDIIAEDLKVGQAVLALTREFNQVFNAAFPVGISSVPKSPSAGGSVSGSHGTISLKATSNAVGAHVVSPSSGKSHVFGKSPVRLWIQSVVDLLLGRLVSGVIGILGAEQVEIFEPGHFLSAHGVQLTSSHSFAGPHGAGAAHPKSPVGAHSSSAGSPSAAHDSPSPLAYFLDHLVAYANSGTSSSAVAELVCRFNLDGSVLGADQWRVIRGSLPGAAIISQQTVFAEDAYKDVRFMPVFDKKIGFKTRSMLCVPLVVDAHVNGQVITHPYAVVVASNKRNDCPPRPSQAISQTGLDPNGCPTVFSSEDIQRLELLCATVAGRISALTQMFSLVV